MKIFTFISLLLMPATLVASFYGMNVKLPLDGLRWAWVILLAAMAVIVFTAWWIFHRKKML
jgi:magnesium transporter